MALIANRVKTKNHIAELLKLVLFSLRKSFTVLLLILSLLLLSSSGNFISQIALETVGRTVEMGSIIYKTIFDRAAFIADRFSYYKTLEAENTKLRIELSKIHDAYVKSQISIHENEKLKKLLKFVEKVDSPFLTAKLLSISSTPFSSTAIIGAGSNDGVELDNIVGNEIGLVGRVIEVSSNYSKVRLIDDDNSRIPVITGKTKLRGILAKQGDGLKIIYLDEDNQPEIGEPIFTSGDGKIFPDGLKVGEIGSVNSSGVNVAPHSSLKKVNYVYIYQAIN